MSKQEVVTQSQTGVETAKQEPAELVSASSKMREELRAMLGKGTDFNNAKTYAPILKELAKKYKVGYMTAKNALDKVLREEGRKDPAPSISVQTIGPVQAEVKHKPKQVQRLPQSEPTKEGEAQSQVGEQPKPPEITIPRELTIKMFASMLKGGQEGLFSIAESAWDVKVKRPSEDSVNTAAELWADVCEAYGISPPKILVFFGATASTVQVLGMPLLAARAEFKRKKEEKAAAEQQATTYKPKPPNQTTTLIPTQTQVSTN